MPQNFSDRIAAKAEFKCAECGQRHALDKADFDFHARSSSERRQGAETQYASEHEIDCTKCGKCMRIVFEVWEYPEGVVNMSGYAPEESENVRAVKSHFARARRGDDNQIIGFAAGAAMLGVALGGGYFGAVLGGLLGGIFGYLTNRPIRS